VIVERFRRAFAEQHEDMVGRPILVALSGGSDSVALLRLLHETFLGLGCAPHAAHVHHHLRGVDADADAAFCAELCRALDVPLAIEHLEPEPPRGTSAEAWWRAERYRLLEAARERLGCAATATAHTLDDQAETVLLKVLRGAGPRGAAGIRRRRGSVIRPLLDFRHAELQTWLRGSGAAWREDPSNLAADRPRSWLRHRVLPLLAAAYPRAPEQLAAFAAALAADDEFISDALAAEAAWPEVGRPVPVATVRALAPALRRRWALALASRLPLAEPPSRLQLAAIGALLDGFQPAAVDLGRRWVVRRDGDLLSLRPPPIAPFQPVSVPVPGVADLGGGYVLRLGAAATGRSRFTAGLAPRVSGAVLRLRPLRRGERWPGGDGRAAVRVLAAARVPSECRRSWPVLEADGTMIWMPGAAVRGGWDAGGGPGVTVELEVPW
jgi:tRNA(Ile)-lysidine synthase